MTSSPAVSARPAILTRFWRGLAAGLLALLLVAAAAAERASGDAARFASGRLWRVERPGLAPSYVFGTFHLPDPRLSRLPKRVAALLAQATSLSLELSPKAMGTLDGSMFLPPGQNLEDVLGRTLFGHVLKAGAEYGLTAQLLQPMTPLAVATVLSVPPATAALLRDGRPGVDGQLEQAALDGGVPIRGLETAGEQEAVLGALPLGDQIALLKEAVFHHDDLTRQHDWIVGAYIAGDVSALLDAMVQAAPETRDYFADTLIGARNRVMIERMAPSLEQGGAFVAVGAAHLPGEGGILDLLADQGYAVTPLSP